LSGAASQSFIYNGANQGLSFSVTGAVASDAGYLVSNTSTTNAGSYTATLTKSSNNYVLGATTTIPWSITPAAASSSPASGITTYQVYDGSTKSATVISGLSGLSYSGSPVASGVNAGTYSATIALGGNYTGSVTGYLVISTAYADISLHFGGYVAAGDTNTRYFDSYLARADRSYTWSASVSGEGAGDASLQYGSVRCTNSQTRGFVVTITATISNPNYTASSSTTSITFEAYVAPPPSGGGGGYGGGGGFIAE
jgi:hypothetical protein